MRQVKTLAWRNAWDVPELTEKTKAALLEKDAGKRAAIYEELQKAVLDTSPFVIIFQQTEVAGLSRQCSRASSSARPSTPTTSTPISKE